MGLFPLGPISDIQTQNQSNPPDDTLSMASKQPWWGEVEPLAKDGYVTVPWSNRLGFEAH